MTSLNILEFILLLPHLRLNRLLFNFNLMMKNFLIENSSICRLTGERNSKAYPLSLLIWVFIIGILALILVLKMVGLKESIVIWWKWVLL